MNLNEIKIADKLIGEGHAPFIIAEMSGNHNQSLERALAIVDAAAKAGADAVKIQTYTADTMTLNLNEGDFVINDPKSLWKGESLYQLYEKAHTPWEWHEPIMKRCEEQGLICFSAPFDATAVDFLETLNVPAYKIASFENTDIPLIKKAASTGKPLIISTGMATEEELRESVDAARLAGCKDLILLKCTSSYPASPLNSNLNTIPAFQEQFAYDDLNLQAGLSDHTLGTGAAIASIALGARVIEKHFTLARADGGVDSAFSLEPDELASLVRDSKIAHEALGTVFFGPTEAEKPMLQFRRSLYVAEDVEAGELFTEENLRAVRPGKGLPPKFYERLLGQVVSKAIKRGRPMAWDFVKNADELKQETENLTVAVK